MYIRWFCLFVGWTVFAQNGWTPLGPGGIAADVVTHPDNPMLLHAVAGDQVFRSSDAGQTWIPFSEGLEGQFVRSITDNGAALYALTENEIFRNDLDGNGWSPNPGTLPAILLTGIGSPPTAPSTIYVSSSSYQGNFKSTDQGMTWVTLTLDGQIDQYRFHPGNPDVVYGQSLYSGFHVSSDGGQTWFTDTFKEGVSFSPLAPNVLYAGAYDPGVHRSEDGGLTWSVLPASPPGVMMDATAVSLTNPQVVYAVGSSGTVYKTTDGGASWFAGGSVEHYLVFSALAPADNILLIGTARGTYYSTDGGISFQRLDHGFAGAGVSALALSSSNPGTLFACTRTDSHRIYLSGQGVFRSGNGGTTWSSVGLNTAAFFRAAVDPTDKDTVYVSEFTDIYTPLLWRSTDGGQNWALITDDLGGLGWVQDIAIVPSGSNRVFIATDTQGFFRGNGTPAGWQPINNGIPSGAYGSAIAANPANPNEIWGAYSQGSMRRIAKSFNGGNSWQTLALNPTNTIIDIAIAPSLPGTVYLAAQNEGVYKSNDGGNTWLSVNNGLVGSVNRLALDPQNPDLVFSAASHQVFQSIDAGASWQALPLMVPATPVLDLAYDSQGGLLYAGTRGGVFVNATVGFQVPTLSAWGLAALIAVLLSTGMIQLYRRRKPRLGPLKPSRRY